MRYQQDELQAAAVPAGSEIPNWLLVYIIENFESHNTQCSLFPDFISWMHFLKKAT